MLAANTKPEAPACTRPCKHKSRREESRMCPFRPLKRQMNDTSPPDTGDVGSKWANRWEGPGRQRSRFSSLSTTRAEQVICEAELFLKEADLRRKDASCQCIGLQLHFVKTLQTEGSFSAPGRAGGFCVGTDTRYSKLLSDELTSTQPRDLKGWRAHVSTRLFFSSPIPQVINSCTW